MDKAQTHWGDYIENLLNQRGWTQAELARTIGVDSSVITGWRAGRQPNTDNLQQMCAGTAISMLELLVESGHITAAQAGGAIPPAPVFPEVDVATAIERDKVLNAATKEHLKAQYGLLVALSRYDQQPPKVKPGLRNVARKRK
jgi:transcriptional regulator with XRE-family HTH domain